MEDRKLCTRCNELKLLSEFYFDKCSNRYKSGCKLCECKNKNKEKVRIKSAKWYLENKIHHNNRIKNYYSIPQNKQKRKEYLQGYNKRQEVIERRKEYLEWYYSIYENVERKNKNNIDRYHNNKDIYRNNELKRLYNISLKDKLLLIEQQNHKCLISLLPLNKSSHVDHCHKTNKIRGILDGKINRGLGFFNEDINLIQKAIDYLQNYKLQESIKLTIENNKEKYYIKNIKWTNFEIVKNINLRKSHKISLYDYIDILNLQDNKCALSGENCMHGEVLYIDHCHKTGVIRGLIKQNYNLGLGYFKDDIKWLGNAIGYLKEHNE